MVAQWRTRYGGANGSPHTMGWFCCEQMETSRCRQLSSHKMRCHIFLLTVGYATLGRTELTRTKCSGTNRHKTLDTRITHNTHATLTPNGVKLSRGNILGSPVIPTTWCTFPDQQVITGLTCWYVLSLLSTQNFQQVIMQFKYSTGNTNEIYIEISVFTRRLFSSQYSSLPWEDYNIHTTHFHIPQLIPPTINTAVVSTIYRSIFEHTQHLSYSSSRPWCNWRLL